VRAALAIAMKDLRSELRAKEMVSAMFLFSLLIVLAFRFGFDESVTAGSVDLPDLAAAALWVCFSFAAIVGMHSSFAKEKDRETLEGLMLCPVERSELFLGKVISNMVLVFIVDVLSIAFFALFFAYDYGGNTLSVVAIAIMGTLTLVLVGTLVAAISVNTKAREVLLPILLIPLIAFSVIMPSVTLTGDAIAGTATESVREIASIAGFAVIFGVIGYLTADYVFEG
jgi:heme exporter protein B